MNSRAHFRLTIETLAAAALCLAWHAAATAQSYSIRPNCNSSPGASGCYIRPGTYGYNDTWWREWPTQHRPEISDPRAIGAGRLPTPPAVPEVKLPPGGNLPSRPPMGSEGSALPNLGLSGSGSTAPLRQPRPGEGTLIAPGADGTLSIPGITSPPTVPNFLPGGEGGAGTTTPAPNVPLLPNLGESGSGSIAPKSGEKEPAKNPELQKPSAKPPEGIPLKPELPSLPGEFQPPKPTAPSGALRRRRDTVAAGDAEPSTNAARAADRQIEPDDGLEDAARHERKLVETNFEQRDSGAKRTLPNALDGYCPVQLQEKEKWVAGRSEFRVTYQGQVFRFSSEAAKERFAAAPEKYAPANGGNDAVLGMEENRIMSGSIQHSAVWQGRLYLFASSANLAAFREDPSRYAKCPPATEPNAVAAPRTAAESTASKRPQQAEERLRLPGDSL